MKKRLFIITGVLIIAAVAAFFLFRDKEADGKTLKTAVVTKGDISQSISATGRLNPIKSVAVGSQVSGTIKKIYVDYNSVVKYGQIIVQLDPSLFEAQVQQARANLEAAEARLTQSHAVLKKEQVIVETDIAQKLATLKERESDFHRNQELYNKGMVSNRDLELAGESYGVAAAQYEAALAGRTQVEVRKSEVESARASVSQTKAALKLAETNLGYTTIRAPMNGIVIARSVDEGQTVAASLSAPTLVTIGDLGMMEVKVSVDEADIGQVKTGQPASFTVDSFPGKTFHGKVSKIYLAPIIQQNVVTYEVVVEIENREGLLMPGMTANVDIITAEKEKVVIVPNAALRVRLSGVDARGKGPLKDKGKKIYVMEGPNPVHRDVVTGVADYQNTEIISGLKEGDEVVVEGDKADKKKGTSSPFRMAH